jgi:hypothetical protein
VEATPSVLAVLNGRDLEQAERRLKAEPQEARERAVIGRGSDYQVYRLERAQQSSVSPWERVEVRAEHYPPWQFRHPNPLTGGDGTRDHAS